MGKDQELGVDMSKQEKAELKQEAVAFVRKVVTEVYGQKATNKTVVTTAQRVIAAIPTSHRSSATDQTLAHRAKR